ncbi:MAG: cell division protein FtsZ [Candidatus Bilamarchaeaceae archaeon]
MLEGIINDVRNEKETAPAPKDGASAAQPTQAASPAEIEENSAVRIAVVGVGGAGCNAVSRLTNEGIKSARTIALNTDKLHLDMIKAHQKHLLGRAVTKGLGSGGDPSIGAKAADADKDKLRKLIGENEIVFVCAGMGGGTGTGAAPIVAQIAKEQGATVIGVVTYPFKIERSRMHKARTGLKNLMKEADTVIVVENDRLVKYAPNLPLDKAFALADEITNKAVRGISDLIVLPSMMNVDYADVKAVMKNGGLAMISIGKGSGKGMDMVEETVKSTRYSPLIGVPLEGAKGALLHVEGGSNLSLGDATRICEGVSADFDNDADIKMGARINESLGNSVEVIAVVTGVSAPYLFGDEPQREKQEMVMESIIAF